MSIAPSASLVQASVEQMVKSSIWTVQCSKAALRNEAQFSTEATVAQEAQKAELAAEDCVRGCEVLVRAVVALLEVVDSATDAEKLAEGGRLVASCIQQVAQLGCCCSCAIVIPVVGRVCGEDVAFYCTTI